MADGTLEEVRDELEGAADDIRRLTERMQQQMAAVERLETLLTEMFELFPSPVLLVDADGDIAAANRAARDRYPGLSDDTMGGSVKALLPADLSQDIMAVVASHGARGANHQPSTDSRGGDPHHCVQGRGAKIVALPLGWTFVVLTT